MSRNPTQMDQPTQVEKFDYADQWDRDAYTETNDIFTFDRKGAIKLTHDGTPLLEKSVCKKGKPKVVWLGEHNLGPYSHPVE